MKCKRVCEIALNNHPQTLPQGLRADVYKHLNGCPACAAVLNQRVVEEFDKSVEARGFEETVNMVLAIDAEDDADIEKDMQDPAYRIRAGIVPKDIPN